LRLSNFNADNKKKIMALKKCNDKTFKLYTKERVIDTSAQKESEHEDGDTGAELRGIGVRAGTP